MKKFNLIKAKEGAEICTKNGLPAKILWFDRESNSFPLVVIINNKRVSCFTAEGKFFKDKDSDRDLKIK